MLTRVRYVAEVLSILWDAVPRRRKREANPLTTAIQTHPATMTPAQLREWRYHHDQSFGR